MKKSAGILLFQKNPTQFLLVHPGGPFWKNKDAGAWTIPKGEFSEDEEPLAAALREFREETGKQLNGPFIELTPIKQKSGKTVYAWAVEGFLEPSQIKSNTFMMEWPPRSNRKIEVPEINQAAWFQLGQALEKINPAQAALLHQLNELLRQNFENI